MQISRYKFELLKYYTVENGIFTALPNFYVIQNKGFEIQATFTRDWIRSDPFGIGSTMVLIHSVYTAPVRNWNGTVPYGIALISGPGHLVPDSRSDPYQIHQVPCKHKAYPYQLRTDSKRIPSRVDAAIIFRSLEIFPQVRQNGLEKKLSSNVVATIKACRNFTKSERP